MSNFIYKLNAMEHASQAEHPDKMGYADKRKAVLGHVAELEAKLTSLEQIVNAQKSVVVEAEFSATSVDMA